MNVVDVIQNSDAWKRARIGRITGSRIKDVMSTLKNGGETAARSGYKWELIAERLSGQTTEPFITNDMLRGTALEPIARIEYELATGNVVDQVGMVLHPTIANSSSSPDGLVADDSGIEIKCPRITTHLKTVDSGVIPPEHEFQMLWAMACCELQSMDFISFCPELPDGLRLFTVRMQRDETRIQQIEAEVIKFEEEIQAVIADLSQRVKPEPVIAVDHAPDDMSTWAAAFEPLIP